MSCPIYRAVRLAQSPVDFVFMIQGKFSGVTRTCKGIMPNNAVPRCLKAAGPDDGTNNESILSAENGQRKQRGRPRQRTDRKSATLRTERSFSPNLRFYKKRKHHTEKHFCKQDSLKKKRKQKTKSRHLSSYIPRHADYCKMFTKKLSPQKWHEKHNHKIRIVMTKDLSILFEKIKQRCCQKKTNDNLRDILQTNGYAFLCRNLCSGEYCIYPVVRAEYHQNHIPPTSYRDLVQTFDNVNTYEDPPDAPSHDIRLQPLYEESCITCIPLDVECGIQRPFPNNHFVFMFMNQLPELRLGGRRQPFHLQVSEYETYGKVDFIHVYYRRSTNHEILLFTIYFFDTLCQTESTYRHIKCVSSRIIPNI